MPGRPLSKRSRLASQEEVRKDDDAGSLAKHYPWLRTFDNEAKARLTEPEVSNTNVVKLMTMLESHVSPEVTKLRNKPNRATKFLGQVRRRVSMVKMGGYMMERECEVQLFPTYGLLMTHIVNITLTSSKVEKYGAQQVAQDLYYFLKLMFHEDREYILDVVLCSTLDEHATSNHKVGFQLFSFIVEDWRCYNDTHSLLMKYCAVANLLFEGSLDGKRFVERTAPTDVDKTFPKFLARTLNTNCDGLTKKKMSTLNAIIEAIKVTRVKSNSRSRLVVVSKKDINRSVRELSPEVSDADSSQSSSNSTLVNVPMRNSHDRRSTSAVQSQPQDNTDPVNTFFSELGIGNFCLDTSGNSFQEGGTNTEYSYERDIAKEYLEVSEDCLVTSSTIPSKYSLLQVNTVKTEPGYSYSNGDQGMEIDEGDLHDFSGERSNRSTCSRSQNSVSFEEDQEMSEQETSSLKGQDSLVSGNGGSKDGDSENDEQSDKNKDIVGYEPMSEPEQHGLSGVEDHDYDDDGDPPKSPTISEAPATLKKSQDSANDGADDSDLEILSEKAISKHGHDSDDNSSTGSGSRDEAEPESGEDYVPNYDVDSDEEAEDQDQVENQQGMEDEDEKNINKDEDIPNPENSSTNENQETLTLSTLAENDSTAELFPSPSVENESGKGVPSPSSMQIETGEDNDDDERETMKDDEGDRSSKISPSLALRKSARASVPKGLKVNPKTSNSSADIKASPKSKLSEGTPPKRMKLKSESEADDVDDHESTDTVSLTRELISQHPSSPLGRGKRKSVMTPKAAALGVGVTTRRTTRSTRSVTPLLLTNTNTSIVPTVTTRGRGKVATPAVETETKKTPVAARSRGTASRGRSRGGPLSRK